MSTQQINEALQVGVRVVDRDGFRGTIVKVTKWEGSIWYDVRFPSGDAVRYTSDLGIAEDEDDTCTCVGAHDGSCAFADSEVA